MMLSQSFLWELRGILLESAASSARSVGLVAADEIPNRLVGHMVGAILDHVKRLHFTARAPQRLISFISLSRSSKKKSC